MYQYWFTNCDKGTGQTLDVNNRGNNNNTLQKSHWDFIFLSPPPLPSLPPSLRPSHRQPCLALGEENHRVVSNFTKMHRWQGNEASLHQVLRSSDLLANMTGRGNISFSPSAPPHNDRLRQHFDQSLLGSPESESPCQATPRIWPAKTLW